MFCPSASFKTNSISLSEDSLSVIKNRVVVDERLITCRNDLSKQGIDYVPFLIPPLLRNWSTWGLSKVSAEYDRAF